MPPVSLPRDGFAPRRLALRAIMDGRGVDALILSRPRSLAHYGGHAAPGRALLVVTAREALLLQAGEWERAAELLPRGCALGHENAPAEELAVLVRTLGPRRVLDLAGEIARQVGGR